MANTYAKSNYRYLLALARVVLTNDPGITTAELAHQLGLGVRAAYNYRKAVAEGVRDPADPVAKARAYLLKHPRATAKEVGAHLGLKRDAGRRYLAAALADIAKYPAIKPAPPAPTKVYQAPKFKNLKEK
jgi:hypothetical protein